MAGVVKLSRSFRESLGNDLTDELEAGFDRVAAVSRGAFVAIVEGRIDLRVGEAKAELRTEMARMEARLRQDLAALEVRLRQEMAELEVRLRREIGELRVGLAATETRLIRWMFLFWLGTIGIAMLRGL